MLRTHTCGELTKNDLEKRVSLTGWVHRIRDHGGVTFIHIRDRYGITQGLIDLTLGKKEIVDLVKSLGREDCIRIHGKVIKRDEKDINKNLITGEIEVAIDTLEILNKSLTPPLEIDNNKEVKEEVRMKYRYLDLRRDKLRDNIIFKTRAMQSIRESLLSLNFLEIETPLFVKSTPEGARDFIVPSRLYPGKCYALPQSPQLYKQLLMVSGFDRYFQFAHCFRDEDLRADRALVHTQIDMEMSFVTQDDVFAVVEYYVKNLFKDLLKLDLKTPFPHMSYKTAMDTYGLDKPDLRFGLHLIDITNVAKQTEFQIFQETIKKNGIVKATRIPKGASYSRAQMDGLTEYCKTFGLKGLSFTKVAKENGSLVLQTGVAKFFSGTHAQDLINAMNAEENDLLIIAADSYKIVSQALGNLRNKIGRDEKLFNEKEFYFSWIVDFPLFEKNEAGGWDATHHIFSRPKEECIAYLDTDPSKVLGNLYDLVLNGVELLSGSIRINEPNLQKKIFDLIGLSESEANMKFGFLLEAFRYGAPPHGGCAMGFDRLAAILCGESSIREVIPFPNNASGIYPIDGSPSEITEVQLKELRLKITKD